MPAYASYGKVKCGFTSGTYVARTTHYTTTVQHETYHTDLCKHYTPIPIIQCKRNIAIPTHPIDSR